MVLRGTLGDFGLPDIFQLVGHQQKTGVLLLKERELEVKIYFVEGNVVKAEQSSRERFDLFGSIMVRAGVISAEQLASALTTQQRTLRRLGDILIEMGACDRATLKEIARLQTTETIYRLFMWRKGTYEFAATAVDYDDQSYDPIRAENILMEGFRMVDEWPAVRKIIPSARCTFVVLQPLPADAPSTTSDDDILAGMAAAMGGDDDDDAPPSKDGHRKVGKAERRVFSAVVAAAAAQRGPQRGVRTVQDIVDVSRMGEFETTKALATLVKNGHLRVIIPKEEEEGEAQPFSLGRLWSSAVPVLTRVALYAVVAAAVGGLVRLASTRGVGVLALEGVAVVQGASPRNMMGEVMRVRLTQAIETFRLLHGRYPQTLEELVTPQSAATGLDLGVSARELASPYQTRYAYRRIQRPDGTDGYALALPLR